MKKTCIAFMLLAATFSAAALIPSSSPAAQHYRADIGALNAHVDAGRPRGEAAFTISGDTLTIRVEMFDVMPGMVHLQHFHGFPEGGKAVCPSRLGDLNGDGFVDITETEPHMGVTMVPFHGDPTNMALKHKGYPKADNDGHYVYEVSVNLVDLRRSMKNKWGPDTTLDLDSRVVVVHSVPKSVDLPDSVASVHGVPAHVTFPIACGGIVRVEKMSSSSTPSGEMIAMGGEEESDESRDMEDEAGKYPEDEYPVNEGIANEEIGPGEQPTEPDEDM